MNYFGIFLALFKPMKITTFEQILFLKKNEIILIDQISEEIEKAKHDPKSQ